MTNPCNRKKRARLSAARTMSAPAYISANELARRWAMSLPAIYRLCERGVLETCRIGERSIRISVASVEKYERDHTVGAA